MTILPNKLAFAAERFDRGREVVHQRKRAKHFAATPTITRSVKVLAKEAAEDLLAQAVAIAKHPVEPTVKNIPKNVNMELAKSQEAIILKKCAFAPQAVNGKTIHVNVDFMEILKSHNESLKNMQSTAGKIQKNVNLARWADSTVLKSGKNSSRTAKKIQNAAKQTLKTHLPPILVHKIPQNVPPATIEVRGVIAHVLNKVKRPGTVLSKENTGMVQPVGTALRGEEEFILLHSTILPTSVKKIQTAGGRIIRASVRHQDLTLALIQSKPVKASLAVDGKTTRVNAKVPLALAEELAEVLEKVHKICVIKLLAVVGLITRVNARRCKAQLHRLLVFLTT